MTERRRTTVTREAKALAIGPSCLSWSGDGLTIRFDEVSCPAPSRLRGSVRLEPIGLTTQHFALDVEGRHRWRPIAPRATVEVSLGDRNGGWRGLGYFDTNWGDRPLEDAFETWDWSRAHIDRDTVILYDIVRREGGPRSLALRIRPEGEIVAMEPPPVTDLPSTFWRLARNARGDPGRAPRLVRTLEDTPFYARTMLDGPICGEAGRIIHESLNLDRLRSPVVRAMLPFRMPRRFS